MNLTFDCSLPRLVFILAITLFPLGPTLSAAPSETLTFEADIRPIFREHCFDCHGATNDFEGGLDLRQVRRQISGGDSGPAIVPGDAEDSFLIQRIQDHEMPPGSAKVSTEHTDILIRWIEQGAKTARPEPEQIPDGIGLTPEERSFWFFQTLTRPSPPSVDDPRIINDIDRFVLARLREHQLDWSPEASRRTLAIRVAYDLTGLPPSREALEAFIKDDQPDAYTRWVNKLLESPHYGERWGRHWLDTAGYADSEGFTNADQPRQWAYHYRDYVIRSMNADKPIDQFIVEQLAGDELVSPPHDNLDAEQIELLAATGFLRMAADGTGQGGVDEPLARNQTIADSLKIVSTSLMGLSFACAQCHDHRYDPILQEDYYRLRAIFEPALDAQAWKNPNQRKVSLYTDSDRKRAAEIESEAQTVAKEKGEKQKVYMAEALAKELEKYDEPLREQLKLAYETAAKDRTDEQKALLDKNPSVNISPGVLYQYNQAAADDLKTYDTKIAEIRAKKPPERFLRALVEPANSQPETQLFYRGDYRQPVRAVAPGEATVLYDEGQRADLEANNPDRSTSGRRLSWAKSLTSGRHPLFNRVFVNRIWMHHFGRGIVGTPSDFGNLGERPTHPELLDWLACELADQGWSLKHLHRLIVHSYTYRQQSQIDAKSVEVDQDNQWLWRYPVRRLEAEIIRDKILTASGQLDQTLFGASISLKEDDTGQVVPTQDTRRSIYLQVRRSQPVAFLQAFDAPIMETNCDRRVHATVAPQSLMLLNSQFLLDQAKLMAERIAEDAEAQIPEDQVPRKDSALQQIQSPWSYGFGKEEESGFSFEPLPHWTGSSWQGGEKLPDTNLGWCTLNAQGGHPDAELAVIRKWRAGIDGQLRIEGKLSHGSDQGNGVRGRIYSSRVGLLGEFVTHNQELTTHVDTHVVAGEEIAFVVDSRGEQSFDSFRWPVTLESSGADLKWQSDTDFQGPNASSIEKQVILAWWLAYQRAPEIDEFDHVTQWLKQQVKHDSQAKNPSSALQQALISLCQNLLGSNEFLYVE